MSGNVINLCCVNSRDYLGRGDEYVRRLWEGVDRHLSIPYSFHVLTEHDAPGPGWWAKLSLFEPGRFKGRCLYFDLDTLIVGSLDDVASYSGTFAGLSDFYHPRHFASGVMAWDVDQNGIWDAWVKQNYPMEHRMGDGGFIGEQVPGADRLQTLFPGQFVSYKAHCRKGIPAEARVVCFHGLPRPHETALW